MMRVFGLSVFSAIALALIAAATSFYILERPAFLSHDIPSVRVGDPGENLVGPDWSGRVRNDNTKAQ
jgi:hypothetical protein